MQSRRPQLNTSLTSRRLGDLFSRKRTRTATLRSPWLTLARRHSLSAQRPVVGLGRLRFGALTPLAIFFRFVRPLQIHTLVNMDCSDTYAPIFKQELALAKDHNRKTIILEESRLTENPVDRMNRLIKYHFWDGLTRRIDERGK